jgi:hypothetical protein
MGSYGVIWYFGHGGTGRLHKGKHSAKNPLKGGEAVDAPSRSKPRHSPILYKIVGLERCGKRVLTLVVAVQATLLG